MLFQKYVNCDYSSDSFKYCFSFTNDEPFFVEDDVMLIKKGINYVFSKKY
jgi:hypothetical protein